MVKLMNICQMSPSIVAMDILIEGNKEKKYRLILDLSSDGICIGRPATTVPDKYFLYIRQAWQALKDYLAENGRLPNELSSTWC